MIEHKKVDSKEKDEESKSEDIVVKPIVARNIDDKEISQLIDLIDASKIKDGQSIKEIPMNNVN